MSSPLWMPLYVGDYIKDTGNLTTVEHGAYFLLIMHYWQHGGLPSDEEELAVIARLSVPEWEKARRRLSRLFLEGWKHKRIDAELATAKEISSKRSASGKRAAYARYNKRMPDAEQSDQQTHAQPQSPKKDSSSTLETQVPCTDSKKLVGEVVLSPRDPVLNGEMPEWAAYYPDVVRAELQLEFDAIDVEGLLPELWDWSGTISQKPNERMKKVYGALKTRQARRLNAPKLLTEMENPPSIEPSAALLASAMVRKQHGAAA